MTLKYLEINKNITELSNFKTNAVAKYYFEIHSRQDIDKLIEINKFAFDKGLKIMFIGEGTNLLFAFEEYNGIVVNNCLTGWDYNEETKILESFSVESISNIAEELHSNGQVLWKRFIGLPGSIGGAVFGNAGCFGLEIENNFLSAEVLNLDTGEVELFQKVDMEFEYRNSIIKKQGKYFIIKASFDLSKKVEKYSSDVDNIKFREEKQPKGNTCGSFFKNPNRENSAGKLIEEIGYKGKNINGAYFSEIHANFLMNDGRATYKDLLNLIDLVQKEVKNKYNINLEPEVRIITN